jgi:hypothetical protein
MTTVAPKIVLRIGSHAEKEYFEKLAKSLDGIMFGGNLLEITPAATCSLIYALATKRGGTPIPYYLDPMTYCFGAYIDPLTGRPRLDLEALKSERAEKRGSKKKIKSVKDSYTALAERLGPDFFRAVADGKTCAAIDPSVISPTNRDKMCKGVVQYQLDRMAEVVAGDDFMKGAFAGGPKPAAVFAPYFYVHERWVTDGMKAGMDLASRTAALSPGVPVHAIVCADSAILGNAAHVANLVAELLKTKIDGVWLWFDGFDEQDAPPARLVAFRNIVRGLAGKMEVFNLHGGYFSLLLAHDGLTGISHGVGYGERKPVAQVIGAAAPTVRYYLPPISKRVGVPDIQRCFPDVGVTTPAEFYAQVCDCAICKGVIGKGLAKFSAFGEMHRANPAAQRDSQTPTAAKMCRFHFLINRFNEPKSIAKMAAVDRAQHILDEAKDWRACYPLQQHLNPASGQSYIDSWAQALK